MTTIASPGPSAAVDAAIARAASKAIAFVGVFGFSGVHSAVSAGISTRGRKIQGAFDARARSEAKLDPPFVGMLGPVSISALSLHAVYTPATRLHISLPPRSTLIAQRPPLMIVPKGNSDPNFDLGINVNPDRQIDR